MCVCSRDERWVTVPQCALCLSAKTVGGKRVLAAGQGHFAVEGMLRFER